MSLNSFSSKVARLFAVAAIALGLAAGNAGAADYTIPGTIGTTPTILTNFVPVGSFLDNIQFDLGSLGSVGGSATPINVSFGPLSILGLSFTSGTIYSGVIGGGGSAVGSFSSGPGGVLSFSGALAPLGTYFAELTGTGTGVSGGSYAFAIAAIPEPGQWLMLLAGIAMLGVMVRRRAG